MEDKQPQGSTHIEGNVENSNVVVGNENVVHNTVDNSTTHISVTHLENRTENKNNPWLIGGVAFLVVVVLSFTILASWNYSWRYDTSYMGGQLNIVVEPFLEERNGRLRQSEAGLILAQHFYSQLQDDVESGEFEAQTTINVEVRGPQSVPPLRNVFWVSPDTAAQKNAAQVNAHIVIYGIVTYDEFERPSVSIRFYVSPDQFGDAQEILGENELGHPILLTGNIQSGMDLEGENEELRNRVQVVSLLMKAIAAYVGEDFQKSLQFLELALSDTLWKQTSGREVVYLLAGNAVSRQALPILLQEGEARGVETIQLAESYYSLAIQSAKPKGDYARAYIGLAGVQNFYAIYRARLSGSYDDLDLQALEQEEQFLERALAAGYQSDTADIPEKVAFNRAQIFFLRYQLEKHQALLEQAEANYQLVIDSYDAGNTRVRELAAHSHSGLALIARTRGDIQKAVEEYKRAINITRIPSLQALYLYHIGNVYYEAGDYPNALYYYENALGMQEDLAKRISQDQMEMIERRINELKGETG